MLRSKITRATLLIALVAIVSMGLAPGSAIAANANEDKNIERLIQDATSASGAKRLQAVGALGNSGDLRALSPCSAYWTMSIHRFAIMRSKPYRR